MKCHWIPIPLYLHMVASSHDGFDLLYPSKGPGKALQLKSCRVSMQQRGKKASQARAKGSRILNIAQGVKLEYTDLAAQQLCQTKPRDSSTDRQAADSLSSPPWPYKHPSGWEVYYNPLCSCSFPATASKQVLQSSASLARVIC